jgi:hypothetical protein
MKKPEQPKTKYLYEDWTIKSGVFGDELWYKLRRKEAKKRLRKMKLNKLFKGGK